MKNKITRRDFIKKGTIASLGVAMAPNVTFAQPVRSKVKIGLIGVGLRGTVHLRNLLERNDVEMPAICDIDTERIDLAQSMLEKAGKKKAKAYTEHETIYKKLLDRNDLDAVMISTPWVWHVPMAIDAMNAGKFVGLEVCGAFSVQECWGLVNTSETTGVPCMILENVCYRRDVMAVLNMIRQNLFGEIIHCHCGYQHDLRAIKFQPGVEFGDKGQHESVWRTEHSIKRNGELYPTHGVGPIATYLDINRGNRFVSLTSSATKSRGLHNYIVENGDEEHPNAKIKFKLGDIVTTVITCANGETIVITHDTNLPRPYSLGYRVQGTKGLWMKDGDQIYIEGRSPQPHKWESSESYLKEFDHPLWQRFEHRAVGAGHGGMDFFVLNAFVESIKRKSPPPLDVYDAAAWSVITPLSERSIAQGGEPQAFPDFTKGRWVWRKPVFGFGNEF
ncbi:MAG: Gfo/Idh/MocA family protein [bacterium]